MAKLEDKVQTSNKPTVLFARYSNSSRGGAIVEEIEIWEIKNMAFILIDKREIQKLAHTITL